MALGDPIPGVVSNDLIRTSWGNLVAQEVNQSVKKAAAQTMAGPLNVTGKVTSGTTTAGNTPPTVVNDLTRKDYVDTTTVSLAGDTMTGALLLPATQSTNANAAVHKTYADTKVAAAGDTMTGSLQFGGGGGPGFSGSQLFTTGHVDSTVNTNISNVALNKIGSAIASGGSFVLFEKGTAGGSTVTVIGSIQMASDLASVNFNTTSDARLKDDLGPIADPAGIIAALAPKHLRWKDTGVEFDGFLAQEVQAVIPSAVTGAPDAVDDDGAVIPQQLALMKMIPYLVGAIQQLSARVAALEAAP
jgi:Chaperone of endosialidase